MASNVERKETDRGVALAWIFFGAASLSLVARTIHGEWEGVWYTLLLLALSVLILFLNWQGRK